MTEYQALVPSPSPSAATGSSEEGSRFLDGSVACVLTYSLNTTKASRTFSASFSLSSVLPSLVASPWEKACLDLQCVQVGTVHLQKHARDLPCKLRLQGLDLGI